MAFMLIEHGLLCLRVYLSPLASHAIVGAQYEDTLAYRIRNAFKTHDQLEVDSVRRNNMRC